MASLKDLIVTGSTNLIGESFTDIIHANSFKTNGGTQNDFVKGDGTLDSNEYVTTTSLGTTLDGYVHRTGSVTENITGIKKFESNVWLYSASGDTPALVFQRGEDNSYIDWKVYNTGGILKFSANRNSGTYTDLFTLNGDSSHQDANLYLNLISTGTATFGTSPNIVSIGSGNVTASGSVNSLSVNSTTVNIDDSGSLRFVKTSSNEDIGPYINGDYDSTNNEPILTFYGSYGDEPVRLTNVADPINAQDAATKHFVTSQGYTTNTGTVTGVKLNTNGTNYTPDSSGIVTLPVASGSVLGVVKIGSGLSINSAGLLTATGGGGTATSISYDNDTIQFDPDTVVTPSTETSTKTINVVSANDVQNVSGTLEGKITSVKGTTPKLWNQLVTNGNFRRWANESSVSSTPDEFARHTYAGTTYMNASRINPGDTDGIKMTWIKAYTSGTGYIRCYAPNLVANHKYYVSFWMRSDKIVRFFLMNTDTSRATLEHAANTTGAFVSDVIQANSSTTTTSPRFGIGLYKPAIGSYLELRYLNVVDLTSIYGAGNEPTAAQFETDYGTEWRTMCEFCTPSVVGYKEPGITFTGYNLLANGNKTVLPAGTYKIEGDYTSISFSDLSDGDAGYAALSPSGGVFTLANAGYVLVEGYNASTTCIHKSTGSVSYAAPTKSTVVINPTEIEGTCDGVTEKVFPKGMRKVGTTYDEIVTDNDGFARTAILRITDDGSTASALATPKTYDLVAPIDMRFYTDSSGISMISSSLDEEMGLLRNVEVSVSYSEYEYVEPVRNTQYEDDKRHIQDWRINGIDNEPTNNSTNVVSSGGVKDYVDRRCRTYYADCYTDAAYGRKNVYCPDMTLADMVPGTILVVNFKYANTAAVADLYINVNDFGSYQIKKIYNGGISNLTSTAEIRGTMLFYKSESYWMTTGLDYNSTYANYTFGNGYATDSRTDDTTPTVVTALYSSSGSTKYYALSNNGIVAVRFKHDVGASATLNIDGKGAKEILYNGAPITAGVIKAGDTVTFIYTTVTNITGHSAGYVVLAIDRACYEADTIYENYLKAGDTIGTVTLTEFNPVADTVHITPQSLGTSQQTQARANISAQETLVSGTNIKTINNQSILGSGNLDISGGGGSSVTVDTALSTTSTNPVENRVITNALSGKVSDVTVGGTSVVSNGTAVIPAIPGDTKVTQTVSSATANWRGVLIGSSNNASESGSLNTTTDTCMVYDGLRYQPSTGTLKATKFKGTLQGTVEGAVTVYSGSGTPSSSLGSDGDIYIKTS